LETDNADDWTFSLDLTFGDRFGNTYYQAINKNIGITQSATPRVDVKNSEKLRIISDD
jgi:hypothetical protein